ncbi:hypothetical protein PUNSTDRAFT_129481, partial [Punctularia strigosozonata HHB-11173 SS5]|uniref:uncharacterized protein n=1 Tax=Punctularia strigosozonata (strain HHB-11173) TaxID=741275 RepID=UPI0004418571
MFGYLIAAARHVVNTLYPAYVQEDENHVPHSLPLAIEYTRETVTTVQVRGSEHVEYTMRQFEPPAYDGHIFDTDSLRIPPNEETCLFWMTEHPLPHAHFKLGDIFQLQLYDGPNQITADVHFQRAIYNNVDDVIVILATLAPPASLRRGHTKLFRYFAYEHYAMLSMVLKSEGLPLAEDPWHYIPIFVPANHLGRTHHDLRTSTHPIGHVRLYAANGIKQSMRRFTLPYDDIRGHLPRPFPVTGLLQYST